MKNIFLILVWSAWAVFNVPVVFAEESPSGMPPMDEKMMAAMKMMEPSEGHRKLDALVGTFKAKTTMWMGVGAAAETTEAVSETKWILNGRFIQQTFKGQFMGKPFEGMGIMGYDNVAQEYFSFWMDSVATGAMKSIAQYDEATQTFTEEGTFSCPLTGKKDNVHKGITKIIDANHYTFEMWHDDVKTGENYKAMEITYERVS